MNPSLAWLSELQREPWPMEHRALGAFLAKVSEAAQSARMPSAQPSPAAARRLQVDADGTCSIQIRGTLLKSKPWYFDFFGIAATAYADIETDVAAALADPAVTAIRLDVDSPGGTSAGLKSAADAIFAARKMKPVYARVEDLAASAAYWLASQAERISAGPMAMIGSIGAFLAFMDQHVLAHQLGLKVDVISSGSLKGAGVPGTQLSEAQRGELQKYVDDVTSQFVEDVARGRGISEAKARAWATGGTWLGEEAVRMGLADAIETLGEMSAGVRAGARTEVELDAAAAAKDGSAQPRKGDRVRVKINPPHMKGQKTGTVEIENGGRALGIIFDGMEKEGAHKWYVPSEVEVIKGEKKARMADEEKTAAGAGARPDVAMNESAPVAEGETDMDPKQIEAEKQKAADEARATERGRVADIKKAFGEKDAAFTLLAIEKGWTLQEAKAEWADVVEAKSKQDRDALAEANKKLELAKKPGVAGATAVPPGGKPADEAPAAEKDFMALSREYAKEHKCSMVEAMRAVNKANPGLHEKSQADWAGRAPQVHSFKQSIGMK